MSQLDLGSAEGKAGLEDDSATDLELAEEMTGEPASPSLMSLSAIRPTYHGVARASALPLDPPSETDAVAREGRHVGFQYLLQQLLTSGPLIVIDLALLVVVLAVARQLMHWAGAWIGLDLTTLFIPVATGFLLISTELGLYPGIRFSPVEELRRLSMAVTSIFAVWILAMAMMAGGLSLYRCVFLAVAYGLYMVSLPIVRGGLRRALASQSWWGFPTLVCGNDSNVFMVFEWLRNNRRLGLRPVGVIAPPDMLDGNDSHSCYLGTWTQARDVALSKGTYWAVVVPAEDQANTTAETIAEHLTTIPHIHILADSADISSGRARHQQFEGLAGVQVQQNLMLPFPRFTKRILDLTASLVGGFLLLPLFFYIAVAVKLSSRGPILYGHDRIGRDGRHFKAWKFRTMFQNSNDLLEYYLEQHPELRAEWEKDHKLRYDPRVTRIGRFIRKTSLDELPQIWNVIRGDMSLVGPRPIVTAEIEKYGPYYGLYTMVTPGITGVWQVSGRNNTTYEERVQLDSYYVRNWSPWLDLYLLLRTIRIVLFADGAY